MSHGATFDLSEELTDLFTKEASGDGTLACIFVSILDEAFTLGATVPLGASAEADFEATKRLLSEDEATYLLFRKLRGGESQGWAFISFVPDTAPVKQKMLYANAKDTLKKNLPGADVIGQDMHFSDLQDVALDGAVAGDHDAAMKHIMTEAEQMVRLDRLNSMHMPCTCHAHAMPCHAHGHVCISCAHATHHRCYTKTSTRLQRLPPARRICPPRPIPPRPIPPCPPCPPALPAHPAYRSSALAITGPTTALKPEPKPKPGAGEVCWARLPARGGGGGQGGRVQPG